MNNNLLPLPTFESCQFDYDKEAKTYSADASDLGVNQLFGRIYADACDEGFALSSPNPAGPATFYVDEVKCDRDNDVLSWVLRPTTETLRRIPKLEGVSVVLFND